MVRPIRPLADLRSIWKLYRLLRREQFDIVHTHSAKAGMIGALAARLAKVPLVLHTFHGLPFYEGQGRLKYHGFRLLETIACKLRHHVFTQNHRDIPDCVKMMGTSEKVHQEGNGVDINEVRSKARRDIKRAEKDFPPGKLRIALVSRLEPVKRISDFLTGCATLAQEETEVSAVIAGYGPLECSLEQKLCELGLADNVRLLGWTPHVLSILALSDIVVLTSEKEGIPRSLIEAMTLGKPVVATDVLGTQELVVNNRTGFLVPLGDPRALVDKIKLLAKNAELRSRFGEAGRIRVEENFNDIKIAAYLGDFYRTEHCRRVEPGTEPPTLQLRRSPHETPEERSPVAYNVIPIELAHISQVIDLHMRAFSGFFLTFLGPNFLKEFYSSFLRDAAGIGFAAKEPGTGDVIGVIVGPLLPEGYFLRLLKRRWYVFCLASVAAVLKRPAAARQLFQALFYRGEPPTGPQRALLSSVAVSPRSQGQGVGQALVRRWVEEVRWRGGKGCYLTTDANDNDKINSFYQKLGWRIESTYRTPKGRVMNRYVLDLFEETASGQE
jgi:glycosyltransferase involved in cell wall biosynthesis/ribosomal protein S18 acetylase RimI-like enzyme